MITTPSRSSCRGCSKKSRACSAASARRVEDRRRVVSKSSAAGRLDQAVAASIRQEFGSPAGAIIGYLDILLEDARREGLESFVPDLARMRSAAGDLLGLNGRS